jgi:hypothetical protein
MTRRVLAILAMTVLLSMGLALGLRAAHSAEKLLGDANCDLTVNSLDATFVLQFDAGFLWPNRSNTYIDHAPALPCPFNADVRGDGNITSLDAALILQYTAGLLPQLHRFITPTPLPSPLSPDMTGLAKMEEARRADDAWYLYCHFQTRGQQLFDQLDGANDHWAVIFCSEEQSIEGSSHLVIYERQGATLVPLLTLTDTFVYLCGDAACYPPDPHPVARDINGDGLNDLAVSQSTSGNCWECSRLRLFDVSNHEAHDVPMNLPATGLLGNDYNGDGTSAVPVELRDLDGDGRMEIIVLDTSWELHGFCHGCSPEGQFVLAWDGTSYADASSSYQSFFDDQIAALESRLSAATHDSDRVSLALSIALEYGHSGRADTAWFRFSQIMSTLTSDCWRQLVPAVEEDLRLSVPPDGSQPTTSVQGSQEVSANNCPFL